MLRALHLLQLAAAVHAKGLTDEPLAGAAHQSLTGPDASGSWTAASSALDPIAATVPGDLITDLQRAKKIGDPLYERNFKGELWDATNWTFSTEFKAAPDLLEVSGAAGHVYLVVDGVKMGAWIYLNGNLIGNVSDQFLRYRYDVSGLLSRGQNTLQVVFPPSNHSLNAEARWMACSGAWDWAPYTSTYNDQKAHTMSKGIWKSIYLVGIPAGEAALEHLQPRVTYNGPYPGSLLTDDTAGGWTVAALVHLVAPSGGKGTVTVSGSWGTTAHKQVELQPGDNVVQLTIPVGPGQVSLWWPNGLGEQTLYDLTAYADINPKADDSSIRNITRRVGFRFVALVTGDDSEPTKLQGKDGSGEFTMRINCNGAQIWSRGANLIPMDEMEGRLTEEAYHYMLKSAQDSNYK